MLSVVTSVYGPTNTTVRVSLSGELKAVVSAFHGLFFLSRGDFNVTLKAGDRLKVGGRDLGSKLFRGSSTRIGPHRLPIHLAELDKAT